MCTIRPGSTCIVGVESDKAYVIYSLPDEGLVQLASVLLLLQHILLLWVPLGCYCLGSCSTPPTSVHPTSEQGVSVQGEHNK
mmetsp:Transcript_14832/g.26360  ORF Transcript_14832/g.26360 Transcript_14832/m.26360 type:complete len:82 (+) Transcript_14832:402-647(+)